MNQTPDPQPDRRPLLVYDGECAFCVYWADYWRALTQERVRFAPYQQVGSHYPQISASDFRAAVQYIAPDGEHASAAEASFCTLSHAPGRGVGLRLYRRVPGFARASEAAYAWIAAHRPFALRASKLLWGPTHTPAQHRISIALFMRVLALILFIAFASFGVQVTGLIGSQGILPVSTYLTGLHASLGTSAYGRFPTLFWIDAGDAMLQGTCAAGALLSLALFMGYRQRLVLALLALLYLSLFYAGQVFTQYQWDLLLIELSFLAIGLQSGSAIALWLARWLLFRFMFMSGAVKLLSGDVSWSGLSSLEVFFETQPLPTPLAWYAHQLPHALLTGLNLTHFVIELGLVFLIFPPRRPRMLAALCIVALQLLIAITGNYGFFNLQVLVLCLLLFDDAALRSTLQRFRLDTWLAARAPRPPSRLATALVTIYALAALPLASLQMAEQFAGQPLKGPLKVTMDFVAPLRAVNPYGVFAHIVTERNEIVIEGSSDGQTWREYEFRYQPGLLTRAPPWVAPHQPRLDWQLWFDALGEANESSWLRPFLERLLDNSPPVLELLATNPFPHQPPLAVRATLYRYRYASAAQRRQGLWWERNQVGFYYPPIGKAAPESAEPGPRAPSLLDSPMRQH